MLAQWPRGARPRFIQTHGYVLPSGYCTHDYAPSGHTIYTADAIDLTIAAGVRWLMARRVALKVTPPDTSGEYLLAVWNDRKDGDGWDWFFGPTLLHAVHAAVMAAADRVKAGTSQ